MCLRSLRCRGDRGLGRARAADDSNRAVVESAFKGQRAPQELYELLADWQAEPRAPVALRQLRQIDEAERLEHPSEVLGRKPDAGVLDPDLDGVVRRSRDHTDRAA